MPYCFSLSYSLELCSQECRVQLYRWCTDILSVYFSCRHDPSFNLSLPWLVYTWTNGSHSTCPFLGWYIHGQMGPIQPVPSLAGIYMDKWVPFNLSLPWLVYTRTNGSHSTCPFLGWYIHGQMGPIQPVYWL